MLPLWFQTMFNITQNEFIKILIMQMRLCHGNIRFYHEKIGTVRNPVVFNDSITGSKYQKF